MLKKLFKSAHRRRKKSPCLIELLLIGQTVRANEPAVVPVKIRPMGLERDRG